MPYSTVADLPAPVRAKLKGKRLRQWLHVFNSAYSRHQSESIAFAEAWAAARKGEKGFSKGTNEMADFHVFLPIAKIDKEKRTVSGYASTPTKDSDGEIVTLEAIKAALPNYMEYGNIREMHALKAVGVAQEANIDSKGLFLTAKIVDESAWQKCLEQVYKGFSIGGRKLDKSGDNITEIELSEISVVDRPANPDCRITIAKSKKELEAEEGFLVKVKEEISPEKKALAKMSKIVAMLAKEGPPAARDGFSLPAPKAAAKEPEKALQPDGVASVNDSRPIENITRKAPADAVPCEAHGKIGCEKCAADKAAGSLKPKEIDEMFEDKKKKKKNKSAKKLAKAELEAALSIANGPSFLTLNKGMGSVGDLSYAFDGIRRAQRSFLIEGKNEGGDTVDKGLAGKLGGIAKDLAEVMSLKASHEGEEALSLKDTDDSYLNSILGEDLTMDKANEASSGDPILDAINNLVKRAAAPTRKAVMDSAKEDATKARKAMKECRKAVEDVHKMLKASYIAKMEKAKKDPKADADGDFDHAGAMGKLQQAFGKAEEARTFGKASIAKMEKAEGMSGRSGQQGQETTDPEAGVYEVPPGVKNLSPSDLATAGPGGRQRGSSPPLYPVDGGIYPGKAADTFDLRKYADKDGKVPAHIAELVMKGAKDAGELEALRNMSRTTLSGGRRPMAFDMNKAFGGADGKPRQDAATLNKALFEGVDVNAINSGDERAHTEASARVLGNLLTSGQFGKSILDPNFKGLAGMGRSSN